MKTRKVSSSSNLNEKALIRAMRQQSQQKDAHRNNPKVDRHQKAIKHLEDRIHVKALRRSEASVIEEGLAEAEEFSGASRPVKLDRAIRVEEFVAPCPAFASL